MDSKLPKVDPNEITITPGGSILYRNRDIRGELGLVPLSKREMGTNLTCTNGSQCRNINFQCNNQDESNSTINVSICNNG